MAPQSFHVDDTPRPLSTPSPADQVVEYPDAALQLVHEKMDLGLPTLNDTASSKNAAGQLVSVGAVVSTSKT